MLSGAFKLAGPSTQSTTVSFPVPFSCHPQESQEPRGSSLLVFPADTTSFLLFPPSAASSFHEVDCHIFLARRVSCHTSPAHFDLSRLLDPSSCRTPVPPPCGSSPSQNRPTSPRDWNLSIVDSPGDSLPDLLHVLLSRGRQGALPPSGTRAQ